MQVKVWGARGSVPAPGPHMNRYGGNTSCVEVTLAGGEELIVDAVENDRERGPEDQELLISGPLSFVDCRANINRLHPSPFVGPALAGRRYGFGSIPATAYDPWLT